jgi:hypothetical protein
MRSPHRIRWMMLRFGAIVCLLHCEKACMAAVSARANALGLLARGMPRESWRALVSPPRLTSSHDGTNSATAVWVDRRTVEFVTVSVGNAHRTSPRSQVGTNNAKLAREAISLIDRDFRVFEDHATLVLEIFTDDEIKIEVGHWTHLPVRQTEANVSRFVPSLQLYPWHLIAIACCVSASRPPIAARSHSPNRARCSAKRGLGIIFWPDISRHGVVDFLAVLPVLFRKRHDWIVKKTVQHQPISNGLVRPHSQ